MGRPMVNQELYKPFLEWINGREQFLLQDLRRAFGCYTSNPNDYKNNRAISHFMYMLRSNGAIKFLKKVDKLRWYERVREVSIHDLHRAQEGFDIHSMPPKDIAGAIHGTCFDHKDMGLEVTFQNIETVERRVYNCWQMIHHIVLQDPEGFVAFCKSQQPDLSYWEKKQLKSEQ